MKRFRRWRKRRAALALLSVAVLFSMTMAIGVASGANTKAASFDAAKGKVAPGAKVKLRGRFPITAPEQSAGNTQSTAEGPSGGETEQGKPAARPSRVVRIEVRPAGAGNWRRAKMTRTDGKGRYSERVKVTRSGRYRAVHADGRRSRPELIQVKSRVRARITDRNVNVGDRVGIKGQVIPRGSKRPVVVKIGGQSLRTKTRQNGTFRVKWSAKGTGSYKARVIAKGDKLAGGSKTKAGRATVYRPAQASWYGPGLYGNRTACGQVLTASTLGVAHKTMPCGTKLKLRHGNNTVKVTVIDRGPFHPGREFDLTGATRQALGFGSTGVVYSSR